ncbi:hypothetical protein GVAV_003010 [Gurleya vavrai]
MRRCYFNSIIETFSYHEIYFHYRLDIFQIQNRYNKVNDDIYNNDTKKRYCCTINLKVNSKIDFKFSIYTKTKICSYTLLKDNEILLEETIYLYKNDFRKSCELLHFTYYVKMKVNHIKMDKNENLTFIKFDKDSENEYYNEKFKDKNYILPNFNFMPIYNFIKKDKFDDMKKRSSVYYNDSISEPSKSDYEALENVVVLDVLELDDDIVIDGQKKITRFLSYLKKIVEYWNSNYEYLRLDKIMIDFNENFVFEKFKTNLSINDKDVFVNIKKYLKESFKDSVISNMFDYNFKPIVYSKNYEFDSNSNLDIIDKQRFFIQSDLKKKYEFISLKNINQNCFLRFNYILTTNINNQKIILNVQFYFYENHYNKFCEWIKITGIKNLLCDFYEIDVLFLNNNNIFCKNILCKYYNKNDNEYNYTQSFCSNINCRFYNIKYLKFKNCQVPFAIYNIINSFEIDFLFGLMLCLKSSKNILIGITCHHLILKNKLIEDIVKGSFLTCPRFYENFKDFEMASLFCNEKAVRTLEEMISNKITLLKKIINDETQRPIQDDNIKIQQKTKFDLF